MVGSGEWRRAHWCCLGFGSGRCRCQESCPTGLVWGAWGYFPEVGERGLQRAGDELRTAQTVNSPTHPAQSAGTQSSRRHRLLGVLRAFCQPGTRRVARGSCCARARLPPPNPPLQPSPAPASLVLPLTDQIGKGGVPETGFIAKTLRVFRII